MKSTFIYIYESHVAVIHDIAEVVEEVCVPNVNHDEVAEEYAGAKAALVGCFLSYHHDCLWFLLLNMIVPIPAKNIVSQTGMLR